MATPEVVAEKRELAGINADYKEKFGFHDPETGYAYKAPKGLSREETIATVRFDDAFGPVDVGQAYMMDHIQNNNAGSLWDKLTATGYAKGR